MDELDDAVLSHIFSFVSANRFSSDRMALRAVCKRWAALIPSVPSLMDLHEWKNEGFRVVIYEMLQYGTIADLDKLMLYIDGTYEISDNSRQNTLSTALTFGYDKADIVSLRLMYVHLGPRGLVKINGKYPIEKFFFQIQDERVMLDSFRKIEFSPNQYGRCAGHFVHHCKDMRQIERIWRVSEQIAWRMPFDYLMLMCGPKRAAEICGRPLEECLAQSEIMSWPWVVDVVCHFDALTLYLEHHARQNDPRIIHFMLTKIGSPYFGPLVRAYYRDKLANIAVPVRLVDIPSAVISLCLDDAEVRRHVRALIREEDRARFDASVVW